MMALFISKIIGKTDVPQLISSLAQNYGMIEEKITKLIFAPHCVMCNAHVDHNIALCNSCWGKLDFEIPLYLCKQCGFPMNENDEHADWDSLCLSCLQKPSLLDGTAATLAYDGVSRDLILKFKQNDALYLRQLLTYLLTLAVHRLPEADMIIPVPLHQWRLWGRRYNQSALLAFALAKLMHSDNVQTGILKRIRYTTKQKGNPSQRAKNLKHAFAVSPKQQHLLKGKTILLIDDVLTTSATLQSCAKTLKKAGADKVYGLTVARVVAPRPIFVS